MIPQLSLPLNRKLKSVLRREYRRLKSQSQDWIEWREGSYRWVSNEVVVLEMNQIRVMYKLLFKEDLDEDTV